MQFKSKYNRLLGIGHMREAMGRGHPSLVRLLTVELVMIVLIVEIEPYITH